MNRVISVPLFAAALCGLTLISRADTIDATAVATVDKGIKALGGEANLKKAQTASWKAKGTLTINGTDSNVTIVVTDNGIDHIRTQFDGEIGGMQISVVALLSGDTGAQVMNGQSMPMDKNALDNAKRNAYLSLIPTTLLDLKTKAFKITALPDEKVGDKPAAAIKIIGPDTKTFTLLFDKDTGYPIKLTAKVVGFDGNEFEEATTFSEYKDMAGIKKATKVKSTRDGEKFIDQTVSEFKLLDKVDPKTFKEA